MKPPKIFPNSSLFILVLFSGDAIPARNQISLQIMLIVLEGEGIATPISVKLFLIMIQYSFRE